MVKNGDEFAIPGILHDQDDLQLITYWWGDDYLDHCIEHEDGAFLETHDFPQTITPLSEDCGGHVLLARPASSDVSTTVEVVAVHIPFGHTMILGKNSWHGDAGLKGLHSMAMTSNHLIMEGTTKSWFLKQHSKNKDKDKMLSQSDSMENFKYGVRYGGGSRECNQLRANDKIEIPAVLHSLVSSNNVLSRTQHDEKVRHEHWDMKFDEGIRKYGPWSTPSSERVAVASQDAKLSLPSSVRFANFFGTYSSHPEAHVQTCDTESEKVYMEHQHDMAHRFYHGAVQRYDTHFKTVGPINPCWMLRLPRSGPWRCVIDRVVGRTLAGTVSFTVEQVFSDITVEDLLYRVDIDAAAGKGRSLDIVSHGSQAAVMAWSDVLLDSYPDPEMCHDGLSELNITVVTQEQEHDHEAMPYERRERAKISLFFGLIQLQK